MILAAHSDASYLTEPGSRSRAGAHIFLSEDDPVPRHNMPVLTISQLSADFGPTGRYVSDRL
eukprot:CCRYP_008021-RA/>CCRYP_008021-RA protein AED:0.60 eAED:0.60 QI:0/-1/0/1/-1/0/1/0/61